MVKLLVFRAFLLIATLGACFNLGGCARRNPSSGRYLDAVKKFADTVIEHGRDSYGTLQTPIFADGLQIDSLTPATWIGKDGDTWVLSNFASQQPLMRLLDGLSTQTGDEKYRNAAEEAASYVLSNCRTSNGLLYWGGHAAWDLAQDTAVGEYDCRQHEVKAHQPYFRLMWRVDSVATRKLMETIWAGHILDWQLLDYNRHASTWKNYAPQWDTEFARDIDVPYPTNGNNLSFCNVTPTLLHSGMTLAILGNCDESLTWSRRLLLRWQQARHPETGLSGGQLSYREKDRAQIALGHVHPEINEAKIIASYHQSSRYHKLPLAQMQAAEYLISAGGKFAEVGKELIDWTSSDLEAYGEHCYDQAEGNFPARMIDGVAIRWQEAKEGYYVPKSFAPASPDGYLLWGYAMACRLTGNWSHWTMTRNLCKNLGLGDPGDIDESPRNLNLETTNNDWQTIYALLELHRHTGDDSFIRLSCKVADNLLAGQTEDGLFPRPGRKYARTGDEVPLAILHLAAVIEGRSGFLPAPILDSSFFHAIYHGKLELYQQKRADDRTYDHLVYYGPR